MIVLLRLENFCGYDHDLLRNRILPFFPHLFSLWYNIFVIRNFYAISYMCGVFYLVTCNMKSKTKPKRERERDVLREYNHVFMHVCVYW